MYTRARNTEEHPPLRNRYTHAYMYIYIHMQASEYAPEV
jgi:hypothetical protein